jgi:chorismate mutase/prephenate dehydratase
MTDKIAQHRQRIDDLDAQILELIEQRVNEAISIRRLKIEKNIPLFTPDREEALIQQLVERSAGKLPREVIENIWMTIIKGGKQVGDGR